MTAPLKPWERAGVNSRAFSGDVGNIMPTSTSGNGGSIPMPMSNAPALPPRPAGSTENNATLQNTYSPYRSTYANQTSPYSYGVYGSSYGNYGGMSGGYGSYGSYGGGLGGYGGYSGFSGYGGYGSMGSGFGGPMDNRFIAAAEESTQHAFQSLESIVRAFGSISMMLDSTFNAVHSSFRAVLGMADQFSRLRSHLSRVFSALAIFRTAKWAYLKLLYFMGLTRQNPNTHALADAWSTGLGGPLSEADIKKPRSSWPITMFMAIIISAPYLIWRIISSLDSSSDSPDKIKWANGEGEHYIAQADYDFTAGNPQELSFKAGQTLRLAPRTMQPRVKGWVLAAIDSQHSGLVPSNYIKIISKQGDGVK